MRASDADKPGGIEHEFRFVTSVSLCDNFDLEFGTDL
jgi:hypothetical protein